MPAGYKYAKDTRIETRGNWPRRLAAVVLLLLILCAALYGLFFFQTRKAETWILKGQYKKAEDNLDNWTWLPIVSASVYEKLGTAQLLEKGSASAQTNFQQAQAKFLFRPASIWPDVLKILFATGRYDDGLAYTHHIGPKVSDESVLHFYVAGFLAGKNQLEQASQELKAVQHLPELASYSMLLSAEIDHRLNRGEYSMVLDREGLPLVTRTLKGQPTILYEQMRPVLQNASGDYLTTLERDPENPGVLTIDYRIQNAAEIALGKYAGAIVLLDILNGDILAATSKTKGVGIKYPLQSSLAFNGLYEPGSIMKVITLAGALEHGVDINKIFPVHCEGYIKLSDGKPLYDWKVHGEVKDINTATAVSCNVTFAKIGLALRPTDLLANIHTFGFDSKLREAFLPLELGKTTQAEMNDRYLADLSIGLHYIQMTPLHAAMIASSIANGGVCVLPRLLIERRNIIGLPFHQEPVAVYKKFMSQKTAALIRVAMQEVVRNAEGTGRRTAIDNFPFAMKTGTAGEATKGYNAITIGFGPLPKPRFAFAIFLDHAGNAEFEGARVTKLFLESIRGYIK